MNTLRMLGVAALGIVTAGGVVVAAAQESPTAGTAGPAPSPPIASTAGQQTIDDLLAAIQADKAHIEYLEQRRGEVVGDDVDLLRELISHRRAELRDRIRALVARVTSAALSGPEVDAARDAARALVAADQQEIRAEAQDRLSILRELQLRMADAEPSQKRPFEEKLARGNLALDRLLAAFAANVEMEQKLGVDATEDLERLDTLLRNRAEALGGRIELALERVAQVRQALKSAEPDEASLLRSELRALEVKLHGAVGSLQATIALMEGRGLRTTEYRQLLLKATGDITAGGFDFDVLGGMLRSWWSALGEWLAGDGSRLMVKLLVFVLILFAARVAASFGRRLVRRAVNRSRIEMSMLLKNFLVSITSSAVLLLGLLVALAQLGVEIGPMLAGLGVAGFIVGFALQETLSNFAAGMMILAYRPFDVGDVVEAGGVFGTVSRMSLVSTAIMSFDNQRLVVPNRKIWGDVIRNITAEKTRRVDLVFGVSYGDDLERVERTLQEVVTAHPLVLADPAPMIRVHKLSDYSVDYIVRPWVKTEDYWTVYWDLTREVKRRFDADGITIPFPQRDVHLKDKAAPVDIEASARPPEGPAET